MPGLASVPPDTDQQQFVAEGTHQRIAVTLYLDPESARSQDIERELRAAVRDFPEDTVELDVRRVTREAMRAEGVIISATPMLILRGPEGSHIALGRLDAQVLRDALARSELVQGEI
jgi:hypothetical protein